MSLFSLNRPRNQARKHHQLRPRLDALEGRVLLNAGDLDTTFGAGGLALTGFPAVSKQFKGTGGDAYAVKLQSDGKIVAAGLGLHDFAVARYNTNGSLDSTFGSGGKVVTGFGLNQDQAFALAIQPDGKIVVVGDAKIAIGGVQHTVFGIVRYNANGSLDTTFGPNHNGLVTTRIVDNAYGRGVVIEPDGTILVTGFGLTTGSTSYSGFLAHYNSNGTLDSSFGQGGIVTAPTLPGVTYALNQVALVTINVGGTPTTRIVVSGGKTPTVGVVERFNLNGSLDTSFGSGGSVLVGNLVPGFAGVWQGIQPDGKILEAWGFPDAQGVRNPAVVRLNVDGSLDTTFNPNGPVPGFVVVPVPGGGQAASVAVQANGQIILAGGGNLGGNGAIMLARLNPDGSLDTSFGTNGVVLNAGSGGANARAVILQPDGKIVTAGTGGAESYFTIARFVNPGASTHAVAIQTTTTTTTPGVLLAPLVLDSPDLWDGLGFKKHPRRI